jgi:transposase
VTRPLGSSRIGMGLAPFGGAGNAPRETGHAQLRDVLRLDANGLSNRQIGASLPVSKTTIRNGLRRAAAAGLAWPLPDELTDATLETRLFPPPPSTPGDERPQPDCPAIHRELKHPGVTPLLLWQEHRAAHPEGFSYSRFCELYTRWKGPQSPTMRQTHVAGAKLFVDYAGTTIDVVDAATGEVHACQLFVAALGASSFTYAEATRTQTLADWIGSHMGAQSER